MTKGPENIYIISDMLWLYFLLLLPMIQGGVQKTVSHNDTDPTNNETFAGFEDFCNCYSEVHEASTCYIYEEDSPKCQYQSCDVETCPVEEVIRHFRFVLIIFK